MSNQVILSQPTLLAPASNDPADDPVQFCTTCGYQNPGSVATCLNCATLLGTTCPMCAQPVAMGGKFCTQCGTPLSDSQPSTAATDRQGEVLQNLQMILLSDYARR